MASPPRASHYRSRPIAQPDLPEPIIIELDEDYDDTPSELEQAETALILEQANLLHEQSKALRRSKVNWRI